MIRWLALAALAAALDQLSKFAMVRMLTAGGNIELTPFFNVVLVHNRGAAFSLPMLRQQIAPLRLPPSRTA